MATHIIVVGNAIDGLGFIGPFDSSGEAVEFAGYHMKDEWRVAELEEPQNYLDVNA